MESIADKGLAADTLASAHEAPAHAALAASPRLQEQLYEHDVNGERAIAAAQGAIAFFVLVLHLAAQASKGAQAGNPWVILMLSALVATSGLRLLLTKARRLPERALDVLNVADVGIFLFLIWSYQFAYGHPAGAVLKAPTLVLLFVLVALRALRSHPRPVLTAGAAAILGWGLLVCAVVANDGASGVTRNYTDYLTSYKTLIGAEVERLVALTALVALLVFATQKARQMLSQATHAGDYAEALDAARRGLAEAAQERRQAEAALAALDRQEAERAQQNELLRQREEELEKRNGQLDAAIENMLQGVAMFDAEQRLIVCNALYAKMYGLTPEQVQPGTTVRQIFDYRLANGHYHVSDTEHFVDSWASSFGEVSTRIQKLADGRTVSVSRRQTPDGGRVVTHQDITEREALNARLEAQNQLLKLKEEQLQSQFVQLDAALNNMVQGLAMFDAEHRLVLCNRRYMEIYGLEPRQVAIGTSLLQIVRERLRNGLQSERSPEQIVDLMLRRRNEGDTGQFYNELGDGRCIAVAVQPMANGGTVSTHQDVTEKRRSEAKIAHMALHDALTGLPNRALLNERLEQAVSRAKRGEMVAVQLLDLDHFKNVNDTLGHAAGDKLLQMVTERLRGVVRETDTIARMGGDEFTILQSAIVQPADATMLARRVIDAVGRPYVIDDQQVLIGTSIGIAVAPGDGLTPDQLVRNADLALYKAKGEGRGAYRFFEPEMDEQMRERRAMEFDLRRALAAGEFELHYQPLVNLERNEITGFEALMRWRRKDELIAPAAFIPLAEETGLIVPIGEWAIRQACADAASWPGDLKVAVNISSAQFHNRGLVEMIMNALAAAHLAPERLELEITETVLLQDSESTLATLFRLRELGVKIAMDDFGTGHSSLRYLQSFPFDRIKIDRSFIERIAEETGSLNIVRAVSALARGLGMATTAEGVETQQQLDTVISEGCTEMQGFLFSRPLPAADVHQLCLARSIASADADGAASAA